MSSLSWFLVLILGFFFLSTSHSAPANQLDYQPSATCISINSTAAPFCTPIVTWDIHRLTYVNQPASDQVAIDYYYYFLAKQGETTDQCKEQLKLISCGRSFTRCINDRAPAVQLCKGECVKLTQLCSNIPLPMVESSCREGTELYKDCHAGASGPRISLRIFMMFSLLSFVISFF